jgi:hypothetical protein
MTFGIVPRIGGLIIWLVTGRKTTLEDATNADTWVEWVVGFAAVILFVLIGILTIPIEQMLKQ